MSITVTGTIPHTGIIITAHIGMRHPRPLQGTHTTDPQGEDEHLNNDKETKHTMKFVNWLNELIKSNTGVSSKSFFLVVVTIIGCLLLLVPVFTLTIEALFMHTIATDLTGMAAYIGSVASLFATAGLTKAWSEKFERHYNPEEEESE